MRERRSSPPSRGGRDFYGEHRKRDREEDTRRDRRPEGYREERRKEERDGRNRDERRDDRKDERRPGRREDDRHRSYRDRSMDGSSGRKQTTVGGVVRNLRIDRHECRKAAIEFLIHHYDLTETAGSVLEPMISSFIKTLDMDRDYYSFTVEILQGLLVDRKYIVIADRWIMGILDEHLQAELRVPDLSILRVAGYELLTHPEIPTTVVINEVNVLAKMYCPEKQSLIHAAVNRMIETQLSIGTEIAIESGERKTGTADPLSALIGLDQEAQLAVILLEQRRRNKTKDAEKNKSDSESDHPPSPKRSRPASPREEFPPPVVRKPLPGGFKISYLTKKDFSEDVPMEQVKSVDATTQTVRDPTLEPGVRIYKIRPA